MGMGDRREPEGTDSVQEAGAAHTDGGSLDWPAAEVLPSHGHHPGPFFSDLGPATYEPQHKGLLYPPGSAPARTPPGRQWKEKELVCLTPQSGLLAILSL